MQGLSQLSFFQLAFRPFFVLSAIYAIWLLVRWTLTLSGVWPWQSDIGLFAWHAHEFQFGFAMAVVIGFILTAAQTWTGEPGMSGKPLIFLVALWLIGRIAMNVNTGGTTIGLIADSGVIITTIFWLGRMLVRSQNKRNFIFIVLFIGFLLFNIGQFYAITQQKVLLGARINFATSWWFVLLISFMSSRVIPFFISKGAQVEIKREPLMFTILCQLLLLMICIFTLIDPIVNTAQAQLISRILQLLYAVSLIFHCYRLFLWYTPGIWKNSLLWSLWVNYWFLPIALMFLILNDQYSTAMHFINLGFIGAMIMTFTARVSLGHTGRKIASVPVVTMALICVICATLIRGLGPILAPSLAPEIMSLSAASWLLALIAFLYYYLPILCQPRADGKPG